MSNPVAEVRAILEASVKSQVPEADEIIEDVEEEIDGDVEEELPIDDEIAEDDKQEVKDNDDTGEETYTPAALAEAIGWEPKDIYEGIMIPLDDGQKPISIGDLKNNHQNLMRENTQLQQKFDAQKTALETAGTGQAQNQQISNEMIQVMGRIDALNREEAAIDWEVEEEMDPAGAVLKRQKLNQARNEANQMGAQIEQYQANQNSIALQEASVKMLEIIPTWRNSEIRQKDQLSIKTHMQTAGFNDSEIDSIADPRTMMMLKELIDLRAEKAAGTEAIKRIRKAPRAIKGRAVAKQSVNVTDSLVKKAKSTGKKGDEFNAIKAILKSRIDEK